MKHFSKTAVLFVTALLITAAAIGVYVPFFIAMKNKTQETANLLVKNEELSGKEARITASMAMLKEESVNTDKLLTYYIKGSEIVSFTKRIEALGPISGTTLSIEALEPSVAEDNTPRLNVRLKATGGFKNIMHLLTILENFPAKFEWKTVHTSFVGITTEETNLQGIKRVTSSTSQWNLSISLVVLNFIQE